MSEKITIEIAKKEDLNSIINFLKKPEIDNLFVKPLSQRNISIEERVKNKFNCGIWLIMKNNNDLIGCRALIPDKNSVTFSTFVIDPKHHKKGYGKQLYETSINFAIEIYKCEEIYVDSWDTNKNSAILAKKFGFEIYKIYEDSIKRPKGVKTVVYRLKIAKKS